VPLIVVPPAGFNAERRIDEPVSLIDIFPTMLDLAGIEMPVCDAVSLTRLIDDPSSSRGAPVVMTWGKGNHSVRLDRWRYTRYVDGTEELYDQSTDAYEWTNLAPNAAHRATCDRLKAALPADGA
jgi:arylsulfatase A-like enzyme